MAWQAEGGVKEERPARFTRKMVTSTRTVPATVKALIAVEPPAKLAGSFFEDDKVLKAALKELGIELERATIAAGDPLDKRGFGGWFDAKGMARGATVCIEIPTIVYPLKESPRIPRLKKHRAKFEGEQRQIMREVEERALEKLLASFKRNLLYHIDMEHEATRNGFHYVPLPELPDLPRKMGVL